VNRLVIRPMHEADIEPVATLMLGNWDGVLAEYHAPELVAGYRAQVSPDWLRGGMERKRVFVVERDGEVVATGALADFGTPEEPMPVVSAFFVRADLHRQGIGRRLLEHLIALAVADGEAALHVPSSRNAVPFYEAAGFAADAEQPDSADEITWMTKRL